MNIWKLWESHKSFSIKPNFSARTSAFVNISEHTNADWVRGYEGFTCGIRSTMWVMRFGKWQGVFRACYLYMCCCIFWLWFGLITHFNPSGWYLPLIYPWIYARGCFEYEYCMNKNERKLSCLAKAILRLFCVVLQHNQFTPIKNVLVPLVGKKLD